MRELEFDDIDMSIFTDEEKDIILTIKNIIADDKYREYPMEDMLPKLKLLLKGIYSDKSKVIETFKKVINTYKRHEIKLRRQNIVNELEKIRKEFNGIIKFINKTAQDYMESSKIMEHITDIESFYLPAALALVSSEYYDDTTLDDELEKEITKYKDIINLWNKKKKVYYSDNESHKEDIKENTNNLVFCLTDDIDLSSDSFRIGFSSTISDLETKSSQELKGLSGGAGLERIRKSTETGNEVDFVDYLKNRYKLQCHFVPYRYRSSYDSRVGLIKFEPSSVVKAYLEERYGLSKQSAYYGVFMIITAGANHKQYAELESFIMKNCFEIERIAELFASNNPDYEQLNAVVDKMINSKKDKLNLIQENKKIM